MFYHYVGFLLGVHGQTWGGGFSGVTLYPPGVCVSFPHLLGSVGIGGGVNRCYSGGVGPPGTGGSLPEPPGCKKGAVMGWVVLVVLPSFGN